MFHVFVTLSVKIQLKSFFCDLPFSTKKSSFLWKRKFCGNFTLISLILTKVMSKIEIIVKFSTIKDKIIVVQVSMSQTSLTETRAHVYLHYLQFAGTAAAG